MPAVSLLCPDLFKIVCSMASIDNYFSRAGDGKEPSKKRPHPGSGNEPADKRPRPDDSSAAAKLAKTQASKQNYEKSGNRKRPFLEHWKKEFEWVVHDQEKDHMYCKICRAYPDIANKRSALFTGCGGIGAYRRQPLATHNTSEEHILCQRR